MSKPILLLDQDGPLADFDAAFWRLADELGIPFDIGDISLQRHRFLDQHIPRSSDRRALRTIVNSTHWFRNLPVTPGAIGGVKMLDWHFDVWICSKPLEANPFCASDKHAWVCEHFPQYRDKLILTPDKSMVHGDILLDDAIKPAWVDRATWKPVVFSAPFNATGPHAVGPRWDWGMDVARLTACLG